MSDNSQSVKHHTAGQILESIQSKRGQREASEQLGHRIDTRTTLTRLITKEEDICITDRAFPPNLHSDAAVKNVICDAGGVVACTLRAVSLLRIGRYCTIRR